MIGEKKLFVLCTAQIHNDEVRQSVRYFTQEAEKRNYAVLICNSSLENASFGVADAGCHSVFDLIPFDIADVIVLMSEIIDNHTICELICATAAEHHIPVMAYDSCYSGYTSVFSYANQSFSDLLNHIFTIHGCRKVDLITGIRGHYGSECMVIAYREVLRANGIPFDDTRVAYGEYWSKPAMIATEKLLAYDIPEAIVCTNDDMAMACCAVLRRHGFSVPEDVIVTGCDGVIREQYHTPRLTTCVKDYDTMTTTFFDVAEMMLDGCEVDATHEIPPLLRLSESCGCHVTEQLDQNQAIEFYHERLQASAILESYAHHYLGMLMDRPDCTVIDYLNVLASHMPQHSCICLRDCLSAETPTVAYSHFADHSELMNTVTLKGKEKRYAMIPRNEIVPHLADIFARRTTILLTSIYWQDEVYGYFAYYGDDMDEECFKLPKLIHTGGSVIASHLSSSRLQAVNEALLSARVRDALTGMLNMNGALKALQECIDARQTDDQHLALLLFELSNLRQINAVFGHNEGDQALLSLAGAISDCTDGNIISARISGDEFLMALILPDLSMTSADALRDVLCSRISSYNQVSGKNYSIELQSALLMLPLTTSLDAESCITEVISRKNAAKHSTAQPNDKLSLNDATAQLVANVLSENRLTYRFQPIVFAKTGEVFAYEALMRTNCEQQISPLVVLQYASTLGRLYDVEWLTYHNVLQMMRENLPQFCGHKVFINSIPGHFLTDADFDSLRSDYSDLLPQVVVEFTERAEVVGEELLNIQNRCQCAEMEIAVDDYGTGYSNVTNLLHYSPNYVKIDHSLISNIHEEPKKQHFVTNIIEFAHANGFLALAEGVETPEELRAVIRFGVDLAQGNYTGRPEPIPPAEIDPAVRIAMLKISTSTMGRSTRKTYMATGNTPIDIAKISLEKYTDVFISQPHAEIIGNFGISSNITIKCKDHLTSHIVIRDLHLSSQTNTPLIILGRNSNITLECDGDNRLDHAGICVPETASLHLTGRGNLTIGCSDVQSSAIGSDVDMGFGNISIDMAGCLQISTGGDKAIGIGGGYARGQSIKICSTRLFMNMDGAESVAIGAEEGDCDIELAGCSAVIAVRAVSGVGIGAMEGRPHITMATAELDVTGSGKAIVAVGSHKGGADIKLKDSTLCAELKAAAVTAVGSDDGAPSIVLQRSNVTLACEGNRVLTIGSAEYDASITAIDANFNINTHSANTLHLAAADGKLLQVGVTEQLNVND